MVKPAADKAMKGEGEAQPGDWCRFCRARQQCKARADYYKNVGLKAQEAGDPKLLKPSSLSQYLELAKGLKQWIEDLQDYALTSALNGAEIPGWKAVEGRGSRGWTDRKKRLRYFCSMVSLNPFCITGCRLHLRRPRKP